MLRFCSVNIEQRGPAARLVTGAGMGGNKIENNTRGLDNWLSGWSAREQPESDLTLGGDVDGIPGLIGACL